MKSTEDKGTKPHNEKKITKSNVQTISEKYQK